MPPVYPTGWPLELRFRDNACWAHVRRKFFDVHAANGSPIAKEALDRIGQLYGVEEMIKGPLARSPTTRTPGALEADRRGAGRLGRRDCAQAVGQIRAGRRLPLHAGALGCTGPLLRRWPAR